MLFKLNICSVLTVSAILSSQSGPASGLARALNINKNIQPADNNLDESSSLSKIDLA